MQKTLSNPDLEAEYLVSKILGQCLLPKDYMKLVILFSEIPMIDTSEVIPLTYAPLMLMCLDKSGLLKNKVIQDFYKGHSEELLMAIMMLNGEVSAMIPMYKMKIASKVEDMYSSVDAQIPGENYDGIAMAINSVQTENSYVQQLDKAKFELQRLEGILESILRFYGVGVDIKIPVKIHAPKWNDEYRLYLQQLQMNPDEYIEGVEMGVVLGRALAAIPQLDPQGSLDPYDSDRMNNFLKILVHPEDFYKFCKLGEVLDTKEGQLFGQVYPEFYNKFYDMYLEEYEKYSYQEQIQFRKSFGIPADDSSLVTICSQYVNKNFNPKGV